MSLDQRYLHAAPAAAIEPIALELHDAPSISVAETIRIAAKTLLANKLRTLLTALGVIIGVAAVVALLALGRGAQAAIAESISANGANLLTVRAGSLQAGGFSSSGGAAQSLTDADATALADPANVPAAAQVAPQVDGFGMIVAGAQNASALVSGVTPVDLALRNNRIASGAFIDESQQRSAANVAVLGARMAQSLFPDRDPLGQTIRINGQRFRVIGVLALKGGSPFGSPDNGVLVPLSTAQRRLFGARDAATGRA
jgi:putative ABC transport system permease protein